MVKYFQRPQMAQPTCWSRSACPPVVVDAALVTWLLCVSQPPISVPAMSALVWLSTKAAAFTFRKKPYGVAGGAIYLLPTVVPPLDKTPPLGRRQPPLVLLSCGKS